MAARHSRRSPHALSTLEQRDTAFTADSSRRYGGPEWLRRRRADAYERFAAEELPTGEEEIWRYSRVGDLDLGRFAPVAPVETAPGAIPPLPEPARRLVERIGERAALVVTVDGVLAGTALDPAAARAGLVIAPGSAHDEAEALVGSVSALAGETGSEESSDGFDDLAAAFSADPTVLVVPAGAELDRPVVVVHLVATGHAEELTGPACFPRTVVSLGEGAGASVIECFVSGEGAALVLPATELSVGDGARLRHAVVQQLGRRSWQLGHSWARAGRDATLSSFAASLGGAYARSRTDSVLDGEGGHAELLAVYLGDDSQAHDFRTLQEHVAARTTSDLVFKGAVGGTARSVYSGMIRMRHGAKGANAFQTNRNLVLSDGAHADSVPNLDIEENDVRCSHASAVGPIDPEQRFYLESRGVPRQAAERLILLGFFDELLQRAPVPVREHVVGAIKERVSAMTEGARR